MSTAPHDDTREALIQAALSQVEEEGAQSLSLRGIARGAGVSHGAPYRHFASLEDLLVAVAERGFRILSEACSRAQASAGNQPLLRFHAIGVSYLLFAWENPGLFRLMFDPTISQDERVQAAEASVYSLTVMAVASAQRQNLILQGDPQEIALLAWAGVHGYATLRLGGLVGWLGLDLDDPEELAKRCTMRVYMGMRPHG